MLAGNHALFGDDLPLTARQRVDVNDPIAQNNLCAHLLRADRQRVAATRWIDVTIIKRPSSGKNSCGCNERIDCTDLVRAEDLHAKANRVGYGLHVVEPVDFFARCCNPDATAAVPTHILSGLRFKAGIQGVAVMMQLGHVVVGDKTWTLTRSMPG
ncbi:MAG: hypothetical protein ACI8W7_000295 [Gammaproteobacteria bacterium]|jgi:hypothetical protein